MSDDNDNPDVADGAIEIAETHRLFRLSPAFDDLSRSSRQIALVPADTEDVARAIASTADALGRNWRDEQAFLAESIETDERHVIGDVIFRSIPAGPMKRSGQD